MDISQKYAQIQKLHKRFKPDSPRTKEAMMILGIVADNIRQIKQKRIIRNQQNFYVAKQPQNLMKLRYEHYIRYVLRSLTQIFAKRKQLQRNFQPQQKSSLIFEIQQSYNEKLIRNSQNFAYNNYLHQQKRANILFNIEQKLNRLNKKHKEDEKKMNKEKKEKQERIKQKIYSIKRFKKQRQRQQYLQQKKLIQKSGFKQIQITSKSVSVISGSKSQNYSQYQRTKQINQKKQLKEQKQTQKIKKKLIDLDSKGQLSSLVNDHLQRHKQYLTEKKNALHNKLQIKKQVIIQKRMNDKVNYQNFINQYVSKLQLRQQLQQKKQKKKILQQKKHLKQKIQIQNQLKNRRKARINNLQRKNVFNYKQKIQKAEKYKQSKQKENLEKLQLRHQQQRLKNQFKQQMLQQNTRSTEYRLQKMMEKERQRNQKIRQIKQERQKHIQKMFYNNINSKHQLLQIQQSQNFLNQSLIKSLKGKISPLHINKSNKILRDVLGRQDKTFPEFRKQIQKKSQKQKIQKK